MAPYERRIRRLLNGQVSRYRQQRRPRPPLRRRAFHSAIGHPNGTSWEDITEYETFDDQDGADKPQSQSLNPSGPEATGLVRRDDGYCSDLTGITKMVCDNVPSRYWFWGAGGGLAIYYSPQALTKFLNVSCLDFPQDTSEYLLI